MAEHQDYDFSISYDGSTGEIRTQIRMPAHILAKGLAFTLADIEMSDDMLDFYCDDIKEHIKQIRRFNGTTE